MAKVKPHMDEYWIARIQYWPEQVPETHIVLIYYIWKDGAIDFIPFGDGSPIRSTQCAQFELLEKIDMERYK